MLALSAPVLNSATSNNRTVTASTLQLLILQNFIISFRRYIKLSLSLYISNKAFIANHGGQHIRLFIRAQIIATAI